MSRIRDKFTTDQILAALADAKGNRTHAAEALGVGRTTLRYWIQSELLGRAPEDEYKPAIWVYDIETSPIMAALWSMWQKHTDVNATMRDWRILTWAGKWFGDDEIISDSAFTDTDFNGFMTDINDQRIVASLMDKFDQADAVVAHNGNKFDQKKVQARAIIHGMRPPTPYKQIDTMLIAKGNGAFLSNRLDYLAKQLCGYGKLPTGGMSLWLGCLSGDEESWDTMLKYNIGDVDVLENVWVALAPWDKRTPSFVTHSSVEVHTCTNLACGSTNVVENGGTVKTGISEFIGYTCEDCGHHMRGRKNIRSKTQMATTLVNAV
jgi:hypothetical protein